MSIHGSFIFYIKLNSIRMGKSLLSEFD